ncbi:MAG: hypothetical protein ACI8UR_000282 [Natronomonas sp.]|jgi:hypothetical protein
MGRKARALLKEDNRENHDAYVDMGDVQLQSSKDSGNSSS